MPRLKIGTIAVLGCALVGVSGCGADTSPSVASQRVSPIPNIDTAWVYTPPIPATLSISEAGKVYLKAVSASNAASDKFDRDYRSDKPLKAIKANAVTGRETKRNLLEVLDTTKWPLVVQDNTKSLAKCVAMDVAWYDSITRVAKRSEIVHAPECDNSDAQLIRVRLHLPSSTN